MHTQQLQQLSVEMGQLLVRRGLTLAAAESCTGGLVAHLLTSVSGASTYFLGGVVSYSNSVKINLLGVDADDIEMHGAVSQTVVEQMARGAQMKLGSDVAVATSGIAGPGGGTPDKPVGTVWMAAASKERVVSQCHHFDGDRQQVTEQAAVAVLKMLTKLIAEDDVKK